MVNGDSENRREVWREEGSPARGIRGWRIYVEGFLRVFSHFEHHYFLNIFSTPFYIDFGSISDPNLDQKSSQSRPRGRYLPRPKLHRSFFRILKDVLDGMLDFEVPRPPEELPKST